LRYTIRISTAEDVFNVDWVLASTRGAGCMSWIPTSGIADEIVLSPTVVLESSSGIQ